MLYEAMDKLPPISPEAFAVTVDGLAEVEAALARGDQHNCRPLSEFVAEIRREIQHGNEG